MNPEAVNEILASNGLACHESGVNGGVWYRILYVGLCCVTAIFAACLRRLLPNSRQLCLSLDARASSPASRGS